MLVDTQANAVDISNAYIAAAVKAKIHIWNNSSLQIKYEMTGHTEDVMAIKLYNEYVVSGSKDGDIKIWNLMTGYCLHTFIGRHDKVLAVNMYRDMIVSGHSDG